MSAGRVGGALALAALLAAALAAAEPLRVAVTPLRDHGLPGSDADRLEQLLLQAVERGAAGGGAFTVKNRDGARLAGLKRASAEARFAEEPAARALALASELQTPLGLAVDVAPLGDGFVLYLQGLDVPRQQVIGSAAAVVSRGTPDLGVLAGAVTRVLAPERYTGELVISIDVAGAQLLVDGVAADAGTRTLPCGPHTLRVTHPAYREFLRFVTIEFARPARIEVRLERLSGAEAAMETQVTVSRTPVGAAGTKPPWFRRPWLVGVGAGLVFVAAATTTAIVAAESVRADGRVACCGF